MPRWCVGRRFLPPNVNVCTPKYYVRLWTARTRRAARQAPLSSKTDSLKSIYFDRLARRARPDRALDCVMYKINPRTYKSSFL